MTLKKIRFGSIEIFGCIGFLLWVMVITLRLMQASGGAVFMAIVGRLPNWGVAWIVTLLCKWIVIFVCKRRYTPRQHAFICIGIFMIAVLSEIFFYLCGRSFDLYDLLATVVAQLIMFYIPIIIKDPYFEGYQETK